MAISILMPLANGFEEIEALVVVDVLRRLGAALTLASVSDDLMVTGGHDVVVKADVLIDSCVNQSYDLIVLPGGPGTENLAASTSLIDLLKRQKASGKWYAAICAAPALVLEPNGLLEGLRATCYPSMKGHLSNFQNEAVVVDKNCVTSQGPGTAFAFAFQLVELLAGKEKVTELKKGMIV